MSSGVLLSGRACVVTGGARGIGRAICERFAEEGARVLVADVLDVEGEAVAGAIGGGFVHLDVTSRESVEAGRDRAMLEFGGVDVVVANAGILLQDLVLDMDEGLWQRTLDVNLTGVYRTCQVFGRQMRDQGRGGRLLITSSIGGKRGGAFYGAYAATKFGVIGLAQSLAKELAQDGILVNCVCPGSVDTAMMQELVRDQAHKTKLDPSQLIASNVDAIALGRWAEPAEIADLFVFLASPLSRYITGQTLVIDGGMLV